MASDAATIAAAYNLYNGALTLVLNPLTKTKATVADKNAKKHAMLATLRLYAQMIKLNRGVTNEAKIGLGIHINTSGPSPVPAPTTSRCWRWPTGCRWCRAWSSMTSPPPAAGQARGGDGTDAAGGGGDHPGLPGGSGNVWHRHQGPLSGDV